MKYHARVLLASIALLALPIGNACAKKEWNNPENENRYKEALKQESEARKNEAKAWRNYDRELGRAQEDVKRVRNEAIKGAIKGGPGGAVIGAGKGATESIAKRAKDRKRNHKDD